LTKDLKSKKIVKALDYLNEFPDSLILTKKYKFSHFGDMNWNKNQWGLEITDFLSLYLSDSWNQYLLLIRNIPTEKHGQAKFKLKIGDEYFNFRSYAQKYIWSFSDKYNTFVYLYRTNTLDKDELSLIEINDPMDTDRTNGLYLVIPKIKL
jgi:hypothetical protein